MPADHPQAWRVYNKEAIERCVSHLNPKDGVFALRTQARDGRLGSALAVAETLRSVVGSSWVVIDLDDDGIDLTILGPAEAIGRPAAKEGTYVLSGEELTRIAGSASPVRVSSPRLGPLFGGPRVEQLRRRLLSVRRGRSAAARQRD